MSRPIVVHHLDGRLVVERGADQRGGADVVAGGDRDAVCDAGGLASARSFFTQVPRYSDPPAGTPLTRPPLPVGGSMLPWKSLKPSSCAEVVGPVFWENDTLAGVSGVQRSACSGTPDLG